MISKKPLFWMAIGVVGASLFFSTKDKVGSAFSDVKNKHSDSKSNLFDSDIPESTSVIHNSDQKEQILKNVDDLKTQLESIKNVINKLK